MKIIAIHDGHNASVSYLEDGIIRYAIQEERLTKIKNQMGFPVKSLKHILTKFFLSYKDIDFVVFCGNHMSFPFDITELKEHFRRTQQKTLESMLRKVARNTPLFLAYKQKRKNDRIKPILKMGFNENQIQFVEHHLCHASSAYFGSPWWNKDDPILILTLDGGGDEICATVSIGNLGKISRISQTPDSNSIGNIYSRVTFMMGFTPWEHEYKLMGLAPYASEKHGNDVQKIFSNYININEKNSLMFKRKINEPTGLIYNRLRKDLEYQRFDNICRGLQDFTENLIIRWVKAAINKTGIHKIALSGGVFMNVKVNKKIMELPEVNDLFIFPSCGDESNVFGAAWHIYVNERLNQNEKINMTQFSTIYFGDEISNSEAESEILKFKSDNDIEYELRSDITNYVGELISKNKIVARANGPMEFGARALGNRSILSLASDLINVQKVNMMIKMRDFWMPFAPVILADRQSDYIINPKQIQAHYMIISFDTTEKRNEIIAAIHQADNTARPQIIYQSWNNDYYKLIKEFENETSVGGLMNTSFNLHGYPIVNDAKDALWVFKNSGLQFMQLGDFIVHKK